jgi:hypothetical protein
MMDASIENVDPDPTRARDLLDAARVFLEDAEKTDTHPESSVVLYWQACVSAMDAILSGSGLRVGHGVGSHALRVSTTEAVVGAGYGDLFERLDEWRRERNDVSYAAVTPGAADVAAMQADARDVVDAAATFLGSS